MITQNTGCYYIFEQERLDSFKCWVFDDKKACNKFALAAAGFYKCKPNDKTSDDCACFFCGKPLSDWDADDDPFVEHKSHSKNCEFINLGRPESELKISETIQLIQSWCENQLNKAMDHESEKRHNVLTRTNAIIETKSHK